MAVLTWLYLKQKIEKSGNWGCQTSFLVRRCRVPQGRHRVHEVLRPQNLWEAWEQGAPATPLPSQEGAARAGGAGWGPHGAAFTQGPQFPPRSPLLTLGSTGQRTLPPPARPRTAPAHQPLGHWGLVVVRQVLLQGQHDAVGDDGG